MTSTQYQPPQYNHACQHMFYLNYRHFSSSPAHTPRLHHDFKFDRFNIIREEPKGHHKVLEVKNQNGVHYFAKKIAEVDPLSGTVSDIKSEFYAKKEVLAGWLLHIILGEAHTPILSIKKSHSEQGNWWIFSKKIDPFYDSSHFDAEEPFVVQNGQTHIKTKSGQLWAVFGRTRIKMVLNLLQELDPNFEQNIGVSSKHCHIIPHAIDGQQQPLYLFPLICIDPEFSLPSKDQIIQMCDTASYKGPSPINLDLESYPDIFVEKLVRNFFSNQHRSIFTGPYPQLSLGEKIIHKRKEAALDTLKKINNLTPAIVLNMVNALFSESFLEEHANYKTMLTSILTSFFERKFCFDTSYTLITDILSKQADPNNKIPLSDCIDTLLDARLERFSENKRQELSHNSAQFDLLSK